MGRLLPFTDEIASLVEQGEPESMRRAREVAASDEIRQLYGDFFLWLASSAPDDEEKPFENLVMRMLNGKKIAENDACLIWANILDLLREYDRSANVLKNIHDFSQETGHGLSNQSPFSDLEPNELPDYDNLKKHDDFKKLFGATFLNIAKQGLSERQTPYSDLLKKMMGNERPAGYEHLKSILKSFDRIHNLENSGHHAGTDISAFSTARAMLNSDAAQLLIGNMFVRIADNAPATVNAPYTDLLAMIVDGKEVNCLGSALSIANIFDQARMKKITINDTD